MDCSVLAILGRPEIDAEAAPFLNAFAAETGVSASPGVSPGPRRIPETEFEGCLDWFVARAAPFPKGARMHFSLIRTVRFHAWAFGAVDRSADGPGTLTEAYGSLQYVGTSFAFRSVDEYRWVKEHARDSLGIRMNDKHIRPRNAIAG